MNEPLALCMYIMYIQKVPVYKLLTEDDLNPTTPLSPVFCPIFFISYKYVS